jgi:hypothetical protein
VAERFALVDWSDFTSRYVGRGVRAPDQRCEN